jgi:hypothetical protein
MKYLYIFLFTLLPMYVFSSERATKLEHTAISPRGDITVEYYENTAADDKHFQRDMACFQE